VVEYLELADNVRRPNGVVCADAVHNFGRADWVDRQALHRLARSLHRLDAEGTDLPLPDLWTPRHSNGRDRSTPCPTQYCGR
jgi:hypothetical protein